MNIKKLIVSSFKKFSILISVLLLVGMLLPNSSFAFLPDTPSQLYFTNGSVRSIVVGEDGTQYLGGYFTYIGPNSGGGNVVDISTGKGDFDSPKISGNGGIVYAVVSDGTGGWFIGGSFTSVGGVSKNGIAHILSDGSLDSDWGGAGIDGAGTVYALTTDGTNLYVGGAFANIGGQSRYALAALDVETGLATDWDPSIDDTIYSLVLDGTTLYVGGLFTDVGGTARSNIASFDTTTGLLNSWDPGASARVRALAVSGSTLYVGGSFTTIASQPRNRIASFNTADGSITAWNPNATSGEVYTIAVSGSTVYAGGSFINIGGQARNRIAGLNVSDGLATSWNPNSGNVVRSIVVSDSTIYVGGLFTTINSQSRNRVASFNLSDGLITSWDPNATDEVYAMYLDGTNMYIGGKFKSVGGKTRNRIASIDADGEITDWNPNANGAMVSMDLEGNTLYVVGLFTTVGGQSRNFVAALDTTTGLATSWNPSPNDETLFITISDSVAYIGGWFTTIGGQSRGGLAAIDLSTGLATSWNPNPSHPSSPYVTSLFVEDSTIYVGGEFTNIGGQARTNIAEINKSDGLATSWNPGVNNFIQTLTATDSTVYVGGNFLTAGGQSRLNIAALDRTTGLATSWNPGSDNTIYNIIPDGEEIYVNGITPYVGGQTRRGLASLDSSSGLATSWYPNIDNTVAFSYSLFMGESDLFAGVDQASSSTFFYTRFPITRNLEYVAGENGTISGDTSQTVANGEDGETVTAIPNEHYHFVSWSDDVTTAERTDLNVVQDISMTATFEVDPPEPSSGSARGTHVVYKPPVKKEIAGCGTRTDGFSILTGESCEENEATAPKDTPIQEHYDFGPVTLKLGMSGDSVKELQNFLNRFFKAGLMVDGKFGPKTLVAVKDFQEKYSLVVDGLVGIKTKELMNNVAKIN